MNDVNRMKLFVVGFGSGEKKFMTQQAVTALEQSDLVIGYTTYVEILKKDFPDLHYLSTPMKKEVDRCQMAVQEALRHQTVALVSSGDSGIYGMAGILLEIVHKMQLENQDLNNLEIEIVPGITAASLAASALGAPLMHDFAVISLSDLLTPLDLIYKRISCVAQADFVICLYNPRSRTRTEYLAHSAELIMQYQSPDTPVGIVRNAGRSSDQKIWTTTLRELKDQPVDMFCVVIIGNSQSYLQEQAGNPGNSGIYMITPRGYQL